MSSILDSDRLNARFHRLCFNASPRDRMYVYRVENDQPEKPAIIKGALPFPDVLDHLRDKFGSGTYYVMIRRGKKLLLSGSVSIDGPQFWGQR